MMHIVLAVAQAATFALASPAVPPRAAPSGDGPRPAWAPADEADSLYRAAREALNRGEWRRASQLFAAITERFPRSTYAADALYWQAFALYRIGTTDELRAALAALDARRTRYPSAATSEDVEALTTRIRGALAARGDAGAAAAVTRTAQQAGTPCDREDMAVRVEALSALSQMDADAALPILRQVLARQDPCSAPLRRRALTVLARNPDAASAEVFAASARRDPDPAVRAEAIGWLARVPGDRAVAVLEELLKSSEDEKLQRAAVRALAMSPHPRARQALHAILEREDAPEALRLAALDVHDRDKLSAEEGAYLRALYPKLGSPRLRERAVGALARAPSPENRQFLLAIARSQTEDVTVRSAVVSRLMRSDGVKPAELTALYDQTDDRRLREQLIGAYARGEAPEYTDKLLDIARRGTDPQLRRTAINYLSRKKDPRATKLLLEIIGQ